MCRGGARAAHAAGSQRGIPLRSSSRRTSESREIESHRFPGFHRNDRHTSPQKSNHRNSYMPKNETKAQRMRALLKSGQIVVSPGVFDGYSVRLVEAMGFQAASTTGAGLSNSRLGQPDIGVMTLRDNVEACYHIARS